MYYGICLAGFYLSNKVESNRQTHTEKEGRETKIDRNTYTHRKRVTDRQTETYMGEEGQRQKERQRNRDLEISLTEWRVPSSQSKKPKEEQDRQPCTGRR